MRHVRALAALLVFAVAAHLPAEQSQQLLPLSALFGSGYGRAVASIATCVAAIPAGAPEYADRRQLAANWNSEFRMLQFGVSFS